MDAKDSAHIKLRDASPDDAAAIAALATQVFLDTYATEGVRPDLAREALREYSQSAFEMRLAEPQRKFIVAARADALIGFAEILCTPSMSPAGEVLGAELVRLYIQPQAQRTGVGTRLLQRAEQLVSQSQVAALWLTAWEGNARAIAFYRRVGYDDVGETSYSFEGNSYANRVLAKQVTR